MKLQAIFLSLIVLITFDGQLFAQTTNYGTGSGTAGYANTNIGYRANNNNSNSYNAAIGAYSMYNQSGSVGSVAVGYQSLYNNEGADNVGIGFHALINNSSGDANTAVGSTVMIGNTTGNYNVGIGFEALRSSSTGNYNTAVGHQSLKSSTGASYNVALGHKTLYDNTTGAYNTALGVSALENNTVGSWQTATGYYALRYVTGGAFNVGLGSFSGPTSTGTYANTMSLGFGAAANSDNTTRIGNTAMTSIGGYANWTNVSDGRFKSNVEEDVMGLDFINALRPVSYQLDRKKIHNFIHKGAKELEAAAYTGEAEYQTGFIAQEVEATAKALGFEHFNGVDAPANENSHYGLRYAEFVVPLVKSVQELSAQTEEQEATIEELKALVVQQQKQIDALLGQNNTTSTLNMGSDVAHLAQNQPNPFSEETNIQLFIPEATTQAAIMISNLEGKQIEMVQVEQRGEANITVAANKLSPGLYLYTLVVDGDIVDSKKMLIVE